MYVRSLFSCQPDSAFGQELCLDRSPVTHARQVTDGLHDRWAVTLDEERMTLSHQRTLSTEDCERVGCVVLVSFHCSNHFSGCKEAFLAHGTRGPGSTAALPRLGMDCGCGPVPLTLRPRLMGSPRLG